MAKRKIIKIDEDKCNGCGECIPNCPEGALQIIEGKARLVSDLFCDGLGACIGHCPQGAIDIEERETEAYSERKVMENIIKQGPAVIAAHLKHLKEHNEFKLLGEAMEFMKEKGLAAPELDAEHNHSSGGCPGSRIIDRRTVGSAKMDQSVGVKAQSELEQWPIQINLVPENAPYLKNADLLIAADCVPFAYANFHRDLLKGKTLLVGCPKLDDLEFYREKVGRIIKNNELKSVTYVHMEVPCCFGLISIIEDAIASSGKNIPFKDVTITLQGERKE
ncbi:MAG TPA: 4Fe-4S binding protein [Candidatus Omnitrophota bacterium]|nr:4Fe-4S binding protein [Candidatus Omnitrophota bacterium]